MLILQNKHHLGTYLKNDVDFENINFLSMLILQDQHNYGTDFEGSLVVICI